MSKYIDAEKLKAEIERRKEKWLAASRLIKKGKDKAMYAAGKSSGYTEFFSLINSLQQEQPEQDITEFEKALDNFGEAYATLVDRDNNPNQGIRINAYHELVQERINEILFLAKEYVKQEQPQVADASKMEQEVDLEREAVQFCFDKGLNVTPYQAKTIARHFYELRNRALEEAARRVYESWMGGTMDDVRRDMVELGKALNARKEE